MKILVDEKDAEGFEALLGETITVFCALYFYTGKLVGVNSTCIKLEDTYIVYETGAFSKMDEKDAQKLPHKYWYVQMGVNRILWQDEVVIWHCQ